MRESLPTECSHCKGSALYARKVPAHGFNSLLYGIGGSPAIDVVLCTTCGHMMLFADEKSIKNIGKITTGWKRLPQETHRQETPDNEHK
jgi:hypothetical protein